MSLRTLRLKAGLTQEELGKRTGTSRGRIADYETGRYSLDNMTLETAKRLCKALRVRNPLKFYEADDE